MLKHAAARSAKQRSEERLIRLGQEGDMSELQMHRFLAQAPRRQWSESQLLPSMLPTQSVLHELVMRPAFSTHRFNMLLLQLAASEASTKRKLERSTSDEKVERKLENKFGHIDRDILATMTVDGKTVRQRIREDRRRLPPGGRLGCKYWKELQSMYGQCWGVDFVRECRPPNPRKPINDTLIEELDLATETHPAMRSVDALFTHLAMCDAMNRTELVGTMSTLQDATHISARAKDAIYFEILKHYVKHSIDYPAFKEVPALVNNHACVK